MHYLLTFTVRVQKTAHSVYNQYLSDIRLQEDLMTQEWLEFHPVTMFCLCSPLCPAFPPASSPSLRHGSQKAALSRVRIPAALNMADAHWWSFPVSPRCCCPFERGRSAAGAFLL